MENRREMAMKIRELGFAAEELGLYLDTHPEDERAIRLHNEYAQRLKELQDKYQKIYGPLSMYYPSDKWRWIEEPWGAFRLEVNYLSIDTARTSCCFTIYKFLEK